jgi:hypothetical protein
MREKIAACEMTLEALALRKKYQHEVDHKQFRYEINEAYNLNDIPPPLEGVSLLFEFHILTFIQHTVKLQQGVFQVFQDEQSTVILTYFSHNQ